MPSQRVLFLCYGEDNVCSETVKYIEEFGVTVIVRDLSKNPMSEPELERLIGNLEINHFVNTLSESYEKNGWDKERPSRSEMIKSMAADCTLIRRPIIKSSRLITIGLDKSKISEMLSMTGNGKLVDAMPQSGNRPSKKKERRGQPATAGK